MLRPTGLRRLAREPQQLERLAKPAMWMPTSHQNHRYHHSRPRMMLEASCTPQDEKTPRTVALLVCAVTLTADHLLTLLLALISRRKRWEVTYDLIFFDHVGMYVA